MAFVDGRPSYGTHHEALSITGINLNGMEFIIWLSINIRIWVLAPQNFTSRGNIDSDLVHVEVTFTFAVSLAKARPPYMKPLVRRWSGR